MKPEILDFISKASIDDFYEIKEIVIACTDYIKKTSSDDLFKALLGQIATEANKSSDKELMQLIVDYKQGNLDSFRTKLIDLFYSSSRDNIGLLSISYPDIGKAFTKYGRENLNMLIIKIEELKWLN